MTAPAFHEIARDAVEAMAPGDVWTCLRLGAGVRILTIGRGHRGASRRQLRFARFAQWPDLLQVSSSFVLYASRTAYATSRLWQHRRERDRKAEQENGQTS